MEERKIIMTRVLIAGLMLALLIPLTGCGKKTITPEEALEELKTQNIPYEPAEFIRRVRTAWGWLYFLVERDLE